MDDKLLKKRLRGKVAMHMLFGLGGAVVIIGALFKILHLEIGPITGGLVLGLGLGTEALIFTVAALNTGEIKEEHDDYVKKVKGGAAKASSGAGQEGLSSKIDEMLKEAKLDVALMNNLTKSIKNQRLQLKHYLQQQRRRLLLKITASNWQELPKNWSNSIRFTQRKLVHQVTMQPLMIKLPKMLQSSNNKWKHYLPTLLL